MSHGQIDNTWNTPEQQGRWAGDRCVWLDNWVADWYGWTTGQLAGMAGQITEGKRGSVLFS